MVAIKVTNSEITVGGVTVSIWTDTDPPKSHHNLFRINVGSSGDDDWICIGGGVTGHYNPGNFLTASFPSLDASGQADWKGWVIFSRDHMNEDVSPLIGYAIGMKIPGLSKQELINNLKLFQATSPSVPHPQISCSVDSDHLLVGGGFLVMDQQEGGGNLATGSFPDSTISWTARSKDHYIPSPSRIQVFAIGIKPTLNNLAGNAVGDVVTSYHSSEDVESYTDSSAVNPLSGMALCGGGAASHYFVIGRYFTEFRPVIDVTQSPNKEQSFAATTNFIGGHTESDSGYVTAYAMGIKFKPASTTPSSAHTCPPGQHWDDTTQSCVPDSPSPPQQSECNKEIVITDATSSGNQPTFVPRNAIDRNPNTKWQSTFTPNPWIRLSLGGLKQVCKVAITWADATQYHFTISVSTGGAYTDVLPNIVRTGTSTTAPEPYEFAVTQASSIQITITQSTPGSPNSTAQISEISVFSNQA